MEFSTRVNIAQPAFRISHSDKLLLMGSCFSEHIGACLQQYKFDALWNPFGILYNPISIFRNLERVADNRPYDADDLLLFNDLYISLDHHGVFSGTNRQEVLDRINARLLEAHLHFRDATYILLTPGTSMVYEYLERRHIVANCHKLPAKAFRKRLLGMEEIEEAFAGIQAKIQGKQLLFTISPVRHWREGAIENQRSKSILTESIHRILQQHAFCSYFPAYEIMMDELRDYRYYAEDMLHPNAVAVKYIWERFSQTYFSGPTQALNTRISQLNSMLAHRVKQEDSQEARAFREKLQKALDDFRSDFPELSFF